MRHDNEQFLLGYAAGTRLCSRMMLITGRRHLFINSTKQALRLELYKLCNKAIKLCIRDNLKAISDRRWQGFTFLVIDVEKLLNQY